MAGEPAAVLLAQSFQQQLLRRDADAVLFMARKWAAVELELTGAIDDVAQEIAELTAAGEAVPAWKLYQMERYQSLMAQLQVQMAIYNQQAIGDIMDQAATAQQLARKHAKAMLAATAAEAGLPVASKIEMAFDRLGKEASEKIAALARGGKPLGEILNNAYPLAANAITNKLISGAALG